MKKKIISFVLASVLMFACLPLTALAADEKSDGEQLYNKLTQIINLIKEDGLYSSEDDDPIKSFLIKLFNDNPKTFATVADVMLKAQDSHSGYYEPQIYSQAFPSQYSYVGIGIEIEATGEGVRINAVTSGGTAEKAGILAGDIIIGINGEDVSKMSMSDVSSKVQGEEGTSVKITVNRNGQTLSFNVVRATIGVSNFYYEQIEQGIGYMKFSRFDSLTTYLQFSSAFSKMLKSEIGALILDLRGNPGGNLAIALNILQDFIPEKGVEFVSFQTREDKDGLVVEKSVGRGIPLNKIVVLTDEKSASAAELIAGVLRDLGYAETVGTKSYGKATGQEHLQFDDGSTVVLTCFGIILPSGEKYNDLGLTPDYEVENTYSKYKMPAMEPIDLNAELYKGNYSLKAKALNQRLHELGYLEKSADYELMNFDDKTLEAIAVFQTANGMKHTNYADKATIAAVENAINKLAQATVLNDLQLEKALEIARTVVGKELPYTLDEDGDAVPKQTKAGK